MKQAKQIPAPLPNNQNTTFYAYHHPFLMHNSQCIMIVSYSLCYKTQNYCRRTVSQQKHLWIISEFIINIIIHSNQAYCNILIKNMWFSSTFTNSWFVLCIIFLKNFFVNPKNTVTSTFFITIHLFWLLNLPIIFKSQYMF